MNICFVYQSDYPWDIRVEKFLYSLRDRGYRVFLVCRNLKSRKEREVNDNINFRRLPRLPSTLNWLNKILSLPFYLNFYWLYHIVQCVRNDQCDVIIIRDLPLLPLGIIVAKIFRIKIIYDMAECYPNMYKSMLKLEENKLKNFIFKNQFIATAVEYVSVHAVDNIIVMIEESRDRLINKGVASDKILIIKNTPRLSAVVPSKRKYENKPVLKLLYVGFVTGLRGIDLTIKALAKYYSSKKDIDPLIEFNIIGIGTAINSLKQLIHHYNLDECIHLHGWCSHDVVKEFFNKSDVGILTYPQCAHWNSTIPNKLFDYMAMGLPVIASEVRPIKRIVDETGCGICIDPDDYDAFIAALYKMTNPEYRAQVGQRGISAVSDKYNWEHDIKKLWTIL